MRAAVHMPDQYTRSRRSSASDAFAAKGKGGRRVLRPVCFTCILCASHQAKRKDTTFYVTRHHLKGATLATIIPRVREAFCGMRCAWGCAAARANSDGTRGCGTRREDKKERGEHMTDIMPSLSRRTFVKTTGALGALAAAGGTAVAADSLFGQGVETAHAEGEEQIVWSQCNVNCGGCCVLQVARAATARSSTWRPTTRAMPTCRPAPACAAAPCAAGSTSPTA